MANFCRECGSKLVNGKCVRPGCTNYAGQPEDSRNVKMEPAGFYRPDDTYGSDRYGRPGIEPFEPEIPDENPFGVDGPSVTGAQFSGYGEPGDDAGAPGHDESGNDAGALGYEEPGAGEVPKGGYSTDDLQKKFSEAGKKADEAIKGGIDKLGKSFERQMSKERSITEGTGRGFTGKGDQTITGIKLVKDEKMVRTYHCTTYGSFRKKEGYMTVTNKRVIFESMDATSRISNEVALDGVSGFKNYFGINISPSSLIIAFALVAFAIAIFQMSSKMRYGSGVYAFYAFLLLVMAGVCFFLSFKRSVVVSVFSSKATGTPISVGEGPRSMLGNGSVYTMVGRPTEDTGTMIREIGAMVQDLQTRGDHAIEDWVIADPANPADSADPANPADPVKPKETGSN